MNCDVEHKFGVGFALVLSADFGNLQDNVCRCCCY